MGLSGFKSWHKGLSPNLRWTVLPPSLLFHQDSGPHSPHISTEELWKSVIFFGASAFSSKNRFMHILPCKDSEVVKITQDLREFLNLWEFKNIGDSDLSWSSSDLGLGRVEGREGRRMDRDVRFRSCLRVRMLRHPFYES